MGELAVSEEEIRLQATRVAGFLRESWSEELADAELEPNAMGGLALAEALRRGWIEPDPSMGPYLTAAEEAVASLQVDSRDDGEADDE